MGMSGSRAQASVPGRILVSGSRLGKRGLFGGFKVNIRTLRDVIEVSRLLHHRLGECLGRSAAETVPSRAKWLLRYLADHEIALEKMLIGVETAADPKAMDTWVYDYLRPEPIKLGRSCGAAYEDADCEEICTDVLDLHNQVMDMYRDLLVRADIPEIRELLGSLLEIEEHETLRLAQQTNLVRDY